MSVERRRERVERDRPELSIRRQCELLEISRSGWYDAPKGDSEENLLLLREIDGPNQAWCCDVTYTPLARGYVYLVAIMDWHTRHVLSWRLSTTQDVGFCLETLEEALETYGKPAISNTDQGS